MWPCTVCGCYWQLPLVAPHHNLTEHCNLNGSHSLILQGIVDGRGKFWNVFAGRLGSLHRVEVLRLSAVWGLASRGNLACQWKSAPIPSAHLDHQHNVCSPLRLVLLDWLLTPFHDTGVLTAQQHTFNQKVSRERVVVDEAFGR